MRRARRPGASRTSGLDRTAYDKHRDRLLLRHGPARHGLLPRRNYDRLRRRRRRGLRVGKSGAARRFTKGLTTKAVRRQAGAPLRRGLSGRSLGPAHGAPSDRYSSGRRRGWAACPHHKKGPRSMRTTVTDEWRATFTNEMARPPRHRRDLRIYDGTTKNRGETEEALFKTEGAHNLFKEWRRRAPPTRRSIPGKLPCWNRARRVWLTRRRWMVIVLRCRLVEPVRGWLSRKVVTCPDADFGTLVGTRRPILFAARRSTPRSSRVFLTQVAPKEAPARVPAGHGVAGRAASNRDLVAAEPKEQTGDMRGRRYCGAAGRLRRDGLPRRNASNPSSIKQHGYRPGRRTPFRFWN